MMTCNQDVMNEEKLATTQMAGIGHKILVMSGKGGVGKTTVSVNLAFAFASRGYKVGIVDADLHGPNVALMTGVEGLPVHSEGDKISPLVAAKNVKVLSIASFLPETDQPVVWRGPRKSAAIRQFLGQGDWEGMDVLVVDCPPGTGDEPMSVAQLIPDSDGVVIVTSPQDVALLVSRKCVNFVRELGRCNLGIVENFSGYVCPKCGHQEDLFKSGGGEKAATELAVPFLGRIPITTTMVDSGDNGQPLVSQCPEDPAAQSLLAISKKIADSWSRSVDKNTNNNQSKETAKGNTPMHIAIASDDEKGLDGQVSMHFGRCPYYVLAEVEGTMIQSTRIEKNPHFDNHQPGQMPAYIRDLGANVILAGGMGPRAVNMFQSFGIEVATGAVGIVGNVLNAYLNGELTGIVPCNHDHPSSCGGH